MQCLQAELYPSAEGTPRRFYLLWGASQLAPNERPAIAGVATSSGVAFSYPQFNVA